MKIASPVKVVVFRELYEDPEIVVRDKHSKCVCVISPGEDYNIYEMADYFHRLLNQTLTPRDTSDDYR